MEKPLEELIGKKIIVETFEGVIYYGELAHFGSSSIKLKHVYIIHNPKVEDVFSLKPLEDLEIPTKSIASYEKVIPWLHPYLPSR